MKIATLISLILLFFGSLHAQGPDTDLARRQAAHEQLTAASPGQLATTLEEKRARLVEAITDADLESTRIMQQEVLEVIDQVIALGGQKLPEKESARMQNIREALAGLALQGTAHEADQLVLEFLDLMSKTSR
jgi:hypothetical protein